jgi:hypothetical protein
MINLVQGCARFCTGWAAIARREARRLLIAVQHADDRAAVYAVDMAACMQSTWQHVCGRHGSSLYAVNMASCWHGGGACNSLPSWLCATCNSLGADIPQLQFSMASLSPSPHFPPSPSNLDAELRQTPVSIRKLPRQGWAAMPAIGCPREDASSVNASRPELTKLLASARTVSASHRNV